MSGVGLEPMPTTVDQKSNNNVLSLAPSTARQPDAHRMNKDFLNLST